MTGAIRLNAIDLTVFIMYVVVAVALGFLVSRRGRTSAQAYFLGGKTLPWYVVATSMVAADVSAEHFIANAGVAYRYGIVPATGATSLFASRLHPELGRVLLATSALQSDTKQATLQLNGSTVRGIQTNLTFAQKASACACVGIGWVVLMYVSGQLKAFRDGARENDPNGVMRGVAAHMTDREINAVAQYAAGLR